MTRIVVDLDRLADLVDRMDSFAAHLTRACESADARVRQVHETWTGSAADLQRGADARWRRGAADVHDALATLRSAAATAHANYLAASLANRRMWLR